MSTEEKTMEPDTSAAAAAAQPAEKPAPRPKRVAYHEGPLHVVFAGRLWRRGVPQEVTSSELHDMTRRAGWVLFGFLRWAKD